MSNLPNIKDLQDSLPVSRTRQDNTGVLPKIDYEKGIEANSTPNIRIDGNNTVQGIDWPGLRSPQ